MINVSWTAVTVALLGGATVAQQPLFSLRGDSAGEKYGYSVNSAGDVDADGVNDLLVGAAFDNARAGSATVYSGATGGVLYHYDGLGANDEYSYAVSPLGDLNVDGHADFLITSIGELGAVGQFTGYAYVYSGVDGSIMYTYAGNNAYDYFGISGCSTGDMNGDGFSDFAIGAPGADPNGNSSGNVKVYSGRDGTELYSFDGDSGCDQFGWFLSCSGDMNNDGYADLIVGAPAHLCTKPGFVRVLSGKDGTTLFTVNGFANRDRFGWCVASAGDIDGDLHDDVFVAAPRNDLTGVDAGAAYVYSGATGILLRTFVGDAAGDQFGWSLAGLGDIDNDGRPDLAVGAIDADQNGLSSGLTRIFSGRTGAVISTILGESAGDQSGFSVNSAGDLDSDGYPDLIIGAIFDDDNGLAVDSGSAKIYSLAGTGTPAKLRYAGHGCVGSDGRLPRIRIRGRASLGESYTVRLTGALPGESYLLNIGVGLNLSLEPAFPNCVAYPYPITSASGTTSPEGFADETPGFNPLPNLPSLVGVRLHHQFLVIDQNLGLSATEDAIITIGS